MAVLFELPPGESVVLAGARLAKRSTWREVKPAGALGAPQISLYRHRDAPLLLVFRRIVAHQYYIAAQSGGLPGATTSPNAEAENPRPPTDPVESPGNFTETAYDEDGDTGGCNPTSEMVKTVNMSLLPPPQSPVPSATPSPDLDNGPQVTPCEDYNTILDEIQGSQGTPPYYDWQYIALEVARLSWMS
jgi:hypothetical protein